MRCSHSEGDTPLIGEPHSTWESQTTRYNDQACNTEDNADRKGKDDGHENGKAGQPDDRLAERHVSDPRHQRHNLRGDQKTPCTGSAMFRTIAIIQMIHRITLKVFVTHDEF